MWNGNPVWIRAYIHPTCGWDRVWVKHLAGFPPANQVSASMFEPGAGFHTAECAYPSAFHSSLGRNGPRDLVLAHRRVAQKLDREPLALKRFDARLLHLLAYAL